MIALLDCNNFYVSCERLFSPNLKNKPVVVLSNNDGCVISRSNEAKELGITMGEPFFKIKKITKNLQIEVLSSNYSLYADISDRIMSILKKKFLEVEVYSIDEAFFYLNNKSKNEIICSELAKKILKWVGIPVSIGIAKTKTLAKISNRVIKKKSNYKNIKFKYSNVLEIKSDKDLDYVLKNTKVADVWGVGNRLSNFLVNNNIKSALNLRDSNADFIKKEKGILIKKTIYELRNIKCYQIEKELPVKKSICVSRSFGSKIYDYEDINRALIVYVHKAVIKLIKNNLFCRSITVFLKTSRYDEKIYSNSKTYKLLEATCDIRLIWKVSKDILKFLYVKAFAYNKVGIILSDFSQRKEIQQSLIGDKLKNITVKNEIKLMNVIEKINKKFGEGKIRLLANSDHRFFYTDKEPRVSWQMKSAFRSACYTTNWYDIPKVKIK